MKTRSFGVRVLGVALMATGALAAVPALAANKLEIQTLSNRPDKLSGGDALVTIAVPPGTGLGDVTIKLNGADVTAVFWHDPAGHALVGLVTGMHPGKNRLEAKAQGASTDKLDLEDHPIIVVGDTSSDPLAIKVVRNKPAGLTDGCWVGGPTPTFVAEPHFLGGPGTSICNNEYPGFSFPRMVAGAPPTNDIIECRLKWIDLADYAVSFTPEEVARLHQIFPHGVYDWSRPGVEQRGLAGTWIDFTDVGKYKRDKGSEDD